MGSSSGDNYLTRTVITYSLFSCTYMSLYVFLLYYFENLYNVGKRSSMLLIVGIVTAECFKLLLFYMFRQPINSRDKSSRMKKFLIKNVFKSILLMVTMIAVYFIVAVLFGAPFLSQQEENLMFSLLLVVLTVLPSCLNVGPDVTISILTGVTTFQNDLIVHMIKRNVYFTLFGAWLGAIVIPLDWDRPWQIWPIPCCLGAILGYTCSHIIVLMNLAPKFSRIFAKKTGKYGL